MEQELQSEFKVDDEFRALIPALKEEEREQLEGNLKQDGCRDPLVVWRAESILLDGHARYDICRRYEIPFKVTYQDLETREDAIAWIIENQLGRRNLSEYARFVLALRLESIFKVRADANRGRRTDLLQDSEKGFKPVNTLAEIAKMADTSTDTMAKVKRIQQSEVPELIELVSGSEISINEADIVARMEEPKRTSLAVQGVDAIKKAVVQLRHDTKRRAEEEAWEKAKNATPEEPESPEAEVARQTLREQYQQEFGTAPGQLWSISSPFGTHRLYIGDATRSDDLNSLMDGALADIAIVDPPYNRGYVGKTEDALNYGKDRMSPEVFQEFIRQASANIWNHTKLEAAMYMWHADGGCVQFRLGVEAADWYICPTNVIWFKQKPTQSWWGYNPQHEPCLVAWKPGAKRNWWAGYDKSTAWLVDKPTANREHPTPKPVELYEKALEHASRKAEILLDTFCGSGTAIEAAHRTGRICYSMEKDAGYAAVILKRMERLDLKIKLISGPAH